MPAKTYNKKPAKKRTYKKVVTYIKGRGDYKEESS